MGERTYLTRFELGQISQMHDRAHYTCVSPEYLAEQLEKIGLTPRVSRFDLAQKIKEIENNYNRK